MLRYLTAGESHGKALIAVLDGCPAHLLLTADYIDRELARRQEGYGRGDRMKIEKDEVEIISGVRGGKTIGSPIALKINNQDWENWYKIMDPELTSKSKADEVTRPRPGHADLAGAIKFDHQDIRNVLERASARETAARVAIGAIAKKLLAEFNVKITSKIIEIGGEKTNQTIERAINEAKEAGETLGGIFEVVASGAPIGLGSYTQWDKRLDGLLAQAVMSIQAIKGVEIGMGFEAAAHLGSEVHDEIFHSSGKGFFRKTNNAGGLEGGVTNGEPIVIRAAMKPISTLKKPLHSVDIITRKEASSHFERSDICAVPACAVIAEAVVAFEIANALLEKFGGDALEDIKTAYKNYLSRI